MKQQIAIFLLILLTVSCVPRSSTLTPVNTEESLPEERPPTEVCDGGAWANVFTWNDIDGDGIHDQDELPLPYITFATRNITNIEGQGYTGYFIPGCCGNCWAHEYITVETPPGYLPTTPTMYELTGENDNYSFGFKADNNINAVNFPDEPEWYKAFTNRGLIILKFHYTDDKVLSITANVDETFNNDPHCAIAADIGYCYSLYIFDVVNELVTWHNIDIEAIQITFVPAGSSITCRTNPLFNVYKFEDISKFCSEGVP